MEFGIVGAFHKIPALVEFPAPGQLSKDKSWPWGQFFWANPLGLPRGCSSWKLTETLGRYILFENYHPAVGLIPYLHSHGWMPRFYRYFFKFYNKHCPLISVTLVLYDLFTIAVLIKWFFLVLWQKTHSSSAWHMCAMDMAQFVFLAVLI